MKLPDLVLQRSVLFRKTTTREKSPFPLGTGILANFFTWNYFLKFYHCNWSFLCSSRLLMRFTRIGPLDGGLTVVDNAKGWSMSFLSVIWKYLVSRSTRSSLRRILLPKFDFPESASSGFLGASDVLEVVEAWFKGRMFSIGKYDPVDCFWTFRRTSGLLEDSTLKLSQFSLLTCIVWGCRWWLFVGGEGSTGPPRPGWMSLLSRSFSRNKFAYEELKKNVLSLTDPNLRLWTKKRLENLRALPCDRRSFYKRFPSWKLPFFLAFYIHANQQNEKNDRQDIVFGHFSIKSLDDFQSHLGIVLVNLKSSGK